MNADRRNMSFYLPTADYAALMREAARRKVPLWTLLAEIARPAVAELRRREEAGETPERSGRGDDVIAYAQSQ